MIGNFISDIARINDQGMKNQRKISSGLEITKPSDDPVKSSRVLYLRTKIDKVQQFQKNIDHLSMWTRQTNTLQDSMFDTFLRTQELAERGASQTMNNDQRADLAAELDSILEQFVELSNEKIEGYYAFGGNYIDAPPFVATRDAVTNEITSVTLDPAGATEGISSQRTEEVLEGQTETVNELGADLFKNGPVDYFDTLIALRDDMRNNVNHDTNITNVKTAINDINANLARVAGRHQRMETLKFRLEDAELDYTAAKAGYEETDYVKAVMTLQRDQQAYEATLAMGAKIMQTSLLDFLR